MQRRQLLGVGRCGALALPHRCRQLLLQRHHLHLCRRQLALHVLHHLALLLGGGLRLPLQRLRLRLGRRQLRLRLLGCRSVHLRLLRRGRLRLVHRRQLLAQGQRLRLAGRQLALHLAQQLLLVLGRRRSGGHRLGGRSALGVQVSDRLKLRLQLSLQLGAACLRRLRRRLRSRQLLPGAGGLGGGSGVGRLEGGAQLRHGHRRLLQGLLRGGDRGAGRK